MNEFAMAAVAGVVALSCFAVAAMADYKDTRADMRLVAVLQGEAYILDTGLTREDCEGELAVAMALNASGALALYCEEHKLTSWHS